MFLDPLVSLVEQFAEIGSTLFQLLFESHSHVLLHFTQPRLQQQEKQLVQLTTTSTSSNKQRTKCG